MILLYLALGGVLGTLARYGLGAWVHSWAGTGFPGEPSSSTCWARSRWGSRCGGRTPPGSRPSCALLTAGFCGAFTTFSTLGYETVALLQQGAWGRAAAYAFGSLGLGLAAVYAGLALAPLVLRHPG